MTQPYDDRYLPATTHQEEKGIHKQWKLTKSQYIVYYWLIAHSCWSNGEKHYYIYDNAWTYKQVAADCGISTKTVQRAIPVFEERGILSRANNGTKAYRVYWPQQKAAKLNKDLILYFISLWQVVDLPLFIKLYTILLYGYIHKVNNCEFTIADLERALNLNTGSQERIQILSMLGLWEVMDLISLDKRQVQMNNKRPYLVYTIKRVETNLEKVPDYLSDGTSDVRQEWIRMVEEQSILSLE